MDASAQRPSTAAPVASAAPHPRRPTPAVALSYAWHAHLVRVARATLVIATLLPAAYVFVMIQYSALTYPFWDHVELVRWLAASFDGHLSLSSLWAPHNHSRPFFYRLVYVLNARLTHWDVRSEYIYMDVAIFGAFALHVRGLWRITGRRIGMPLLVASLVFSVVYFSPAGHNNHWWSMMLQLDLTNLFVVYALWRLALTPRGVAANVLAAAAGWAATYTLTNGLVLMVALAIMAHLPRPQILKPGRMTVFWGLNLVAVFATYLHGLPEQPGARPGPVDLARFVFVYLGAPLGELVHYPFHGIFDLPRTTWFNGTVGAGVLAVACALCVHAWRRMRAGDAAALLLAGCTLFSVGSALVTAWGRARFDSFGVAEANSSRYTIFSAFLLYGVVGYLAALAARGELAGLVPSSRIVRRAAGVAASAGLVAFLVLASVAYGRGLSVYEDAHHWNAVLANAYALGRHDAARDHDIYPNAAFAEQAKATMLRLRLGPYRDISTVGFSSPRIADASSYREPVELAPTVPVSGVFVATRPVLVGVSVSVVTWGTTPSGSLVWRLTDATTARTLANGAVAVDGARDWGDLRVDLAGIPLTPGHRYRIFFRAPTAIAGHFGFPLFRGRRPGVPAVTVASRPRRGEALHLTEWYLS